MTREILIVAHPRRVAAHERVQQVLNMLIAADISPRVLADEAGALELACSEVVGGDEHAADGTELFARLMVVEPKASVALEIVPGTGDAVVTCDGRRTVRVPHGGRVEVSVGRTPVKLARLHPQSFTDRLVGKFDLPVDGWRGS